MKVVADRGASLVARDATAPVSYYGYLSLAEPDKIPTALNSKQPLAAMRFGMAASGFSGRQISAFAPEI
jgi:hypothetical protein